MPRIHTKSDPALLFSPRETLELFVARAEELQHSRLLANDFSPSFSMNWDRVSGLRFHSNEPDEEDLRSYLITFRKFIAQREPLYLFKIYNICLQYLLSDKMRDNLLEARAAWTKQLRDGGFRLNFNDRNISPEYITDLWINGYYFHDEPEKYRKLKSLLPHENMLVRHVFLDHLLEATRQIAYLTFVIKVAMRDGLFNPMN